MAEKVASGIQSIDHADHYSGVVHHFPLLRRSRYTLNLYAESSLYTIASAGFMQHVGIDRCQNSSNTSRLQVCFSSERAVSFEDNAELSQNILIETRQRSYTGGVCIAGPSNQPRPEHTCVSSLQIQSVLAPKRYIRVCARVLHTRHIGPLPARPRQ